MSTYVKKEMKEPRTGAAEVCGAENNTKRQENKKARHVKKTVTKANKG